MEFLNDSESFIDEIVPEVDPTDSASFMDEIVSEVDSIGETVQPTSELFLMSSPWLTLIMISLYYILVKVSSPSTLSEP